MLVLNWKEYDLFYFFPFYNISISLQQANHSLITFNSGDEACPNNFKNIQGKVFEKELFFEYIWCDIMNKLFNNKYF